MFRRPMLISLCLLATVFPPAPSHAATISVDREVVVRDDGACSLPEAVDNANQDRQIWDDCPAGSGADRLELSPGFLYAATEPWPGADAALPPIIDDLAIFGQGATLARDATDPFRLIDVLGGDVKIEALVLEDGLSDDTMVGGGAIRVSGANLELQSTVLRDNRADGLFTFGGAIRMDNAVVTILDSQLLGNIARSTNPEHGGGAIAQFDGELTIRRSALLENFADVPCNPSFPDTVASTGGALRVEAISNTGAQAYIYDSTIADNVARVGGGIHLVAIADTGVAGIQDVFVQVMRSTVVFNLAASCGTLPGLGDGIHVQRANGGTGLVAFGNTILHGNGRLVTGDYLGIDCSANSTSANFFPLEGSILDGDDQCPSFGFDAFEDDVASVIDPVRNGDHYLPLANGPAVDFFEAGVNCAPVEPDQLGNPRAGGPGAGGNLCDSGAIEFQPIGFRFTLDVALAGGGTGTVTSTPASIHCPGVCAADFDDGGVVELQAVPDAGQSFAGWSGACGGTGSCTVTMDQARSVIATFDPPSSFALNVSVLGGSGTIVSTPAGIDCPATCTADLPSGTQVELIQTPAPGFEFDGWGGACGGDGACVISMDQNRAVAANYVALNHLNVTVVGSGAVSSTPVGIDCPGTCGADFLPAEKVLLQPHPFSGSTFTGWSGDCSGSGPCVVDMQQDRQVTATFETVEFELLVVLEGEGAGQVAEVPGPGAIDCPGTCTAKYPAGTNVTLDASVDSGSNFQGFGGDCQGGSCTVSMDQDRMVRAVFRSADQVFLDSFE